MTVPALGGQSGLDMGWENLVARCSVRKKVQQQWERESVQQWERESVRGSREKGKRAQSKRAKGKRAEQQSEGEW